MNRASAFLETLNLIVVKLKAACSLLSYFSGSPTVSMYTSVTFTFMRSNSRIMSIAALCDISFKLKGFVWSMFAEISFGDSVRIT